MVKYVEMARQNKGVILVAVLVVGIALFIYFKGKQAGKVFIPEAKYPKEGGLASGFNPNILADELHEVMSADFPPVSGDTKDAAWSELLGLPDNMITLVYNTFNKKYGKEGDGSLTEWIKDESYYNYLSGIKGKVLSKLQQLRLN